jgi:protein-tyrosine kinase
MHDKLLHPREEQMELEEGFRTLRTNLLLRVKTGQRCFLVTSGLPKEGKTSTVVGLARCLSRMRRVLLVDADLRQPQLHNWFRIGNDRGLSDCTHLQNDSAMIQSIDGMSVICSGPPLIDPQDFFVSRSFERALAYMLAHFDIVLFDSSPVLTVADGLLLASMVDGVVMVLRSGVITPAAALEAARKIQSAGGQLLGSVLTGFPQQRPYNSYGPHYGVETQEELVPTAVHNVTFECSR